MMDLHIPPLEIMLRLGTAIAFALIIGINREQQGKPAGIRTHMLVSLGSAAFVLGALELAHGPLAENELDPTRVIEGIIGGIGFLGAGTIIQARGNVQGLTTGASVWIAGSIGVACGGGFYMLGGIVAVLAFVILAIVGYIEGRYFPDSPEDRTGEAAAKNDTTESPRNS